jgi:pyridoxine 5-phosphate synthase
MPSLGVNIDHVATLRQARMADEPDVAAAAAAAEAGGADGVTVHLREDRRHIQDNDVRRLAKSLCTKLNLEMAVSEDVVAVALELRPADACIVPERRQELTTEGGLDVRAGGKRLIDVIRRLKENGTRVSLFIAPDPEVLRASRDAGEPCVELHTGKYAHARSDDDVRRETDAIARAAALGHKLGLQVNAGHGLTYANVSRVAAIPGLAEFNIGHSIIARAVFVGIETAVREMKTLVAGERTGEPKKDRHKKS